MFARLSFSNYMKRKPWGIFYFHFRVHSRIIEWETQFSVELLASRIYVTCIELKRKADNRFYQQFNYSRNLYSSSSSQIHDPLNFALKIWILQSGRVREGIDWSTLVAYVIFRIFSPFFIYFYFCALHITLQSTRGLDWHFTSFLNIVNFHREKKLASTRHPRHQHRHRKERQANVMRKLKRDIRSSERAEIQHSWFDLYFTMLHKQLKWAIDWEWKSVCIFSHFHSYFCVVKKHWSTWDFFNL
jgi:hypothetical protein